MPAAAQPHGAEKPHSAGEKRTMTYPPAAIVKRRKRRYVTLVLLVLLLGGGWIAFWKYAQLKVEDTIAGWQAREARAGRVYDCGTQAVGGFPFRFELMCDRARATISSATPPVEVMAPNVHLAAQVYQPTLLIAEIKGPLTYAQAGQAGYVAKWSLAQASLRGTPRAPERVSIVLDGPAVKRADPATPVLSAKRLELHGRMLEGSATANPVLEFVLRSQQLAVPAAGPVAAKPVDADIDLVLRGLKDFAPKPWPQRFREVADAHGQVEVRHARLVQGETLAVGAGTLTIDAQGRLDGQLNVTVAGAEALINEVLAANRQKLGFSMSVGLGLLGGNKKLEGRPAIALPLRVNRGTVYLGPLKLGEVPPLF
jgi:hypothetical protein